MGLNTSVRLIIREGSNQMNLEIVSAIGRPDPDREKRVPTIPLSSTECKAIPLSGQWTGTGSGSATGTSTPGG
jgi:hypothetical protein